MNTRSMAILVLSLAGCATSTKIKDVYSVKSPEFSTPVIELQVDKSHDNDRGEANALETGLNKKLSENGYTVGPGNLKLTVELLGISRGSTAANVLVGFNSVGADTVDANVRVLDSHNEVVMAFTVNGKVKNK